MRKPTTVMEQFWEHYAARWILIKNSDDVDQVTRMLYVIESIVLRQEKAGLFCTSIAVMDFLDAATRADKINFRNMGLYILFRYFLKKFSQEGVTS